MTAQATLLAEANKTICTAQVDYHCACRAGDVCRLAVETETMHFFDPGDGRRHRRLAGRAAGRDRVSRPSRAEVEEAIDRAWELLDESAPGEVAGLLRPLLARGVSRVDHRADLHHLLGVACEELGDRDGMVAEWLEARRLDVEDDAAGRALSDAEFARVVQDALDELPSPILERLRNVPVIADDRPSEEMVRDGTDPRILGLFHGLSMPRESTLGPAYPDTIHLFRGISNG